MAMTLLGQVGGLWRYPVNSMAGHQPPCHTISLDPATGAHSPEVLRYVARQWGRYAGIHAAVLVEGIVRQGDTIALLD
jgi:MOSC domain-containing protein